MSAESGAETSGGDGFLSGFWDAPEESCMLEEENRETPEEAAPPAGEMENTGGQPRDQPEEETPEDGAPGDAEAAAQGGQPGLLAVEFGGRTVGLPADAVQAISQAMGTDAAVLLQKGAAYDGKDSRMLAVLGDYAQAAGVSVEEYVGMLEQARDKQLVEREMENIRDRYPEGTPDEALRDIAQSMLRYRREEEARQKAQDAERMQAARQNIERQAAVLQREAQAKAWNEYVRAAGITAKEQIPKELVQMVVREGLSPLAAHYKMQAETARQEAAAREKEAANRRESPGSLTGGMTENDPFLKGFWEA